MYRITISKKDGSNFPNGQPIIMYKSNTKSIPVMRDLRLELVKAIETALGNDNWQKVYLWSRQSVVDRLGCFDYYIRIDGRDRVSARLDYFSVDDLAARVLGDKFINIYCK